MIHTKFPQESKTKGETWLQGSVVKKAILPTLCFAALSTIAFENLVYAAQTNNTQAGTQSTIKYVNVTSGSLNVRAASSTGAAIVTSLAKGTAVTVYSEANGWAKVDANGKTGYVSSQFLAAQKPNSSSTSSTSTTTKYVNVSSGSLNLRASASTSAAVLSSLAKGTAVSVLSEANGWAKVSANGKTGFVSSDFLAAQKSNSGSTSSTSTTTKYVNVSSGSLNLRASASTSAAVLSSLAKGTAVSVLSEANGWAKVSANGKTGFVSSDFLAAQKSNSGSTSSTSTTTKYVNVSSGSLNLRASASTSAAVLSSLAKGTAVTVLSEANGWAKVSANGKTGFVSSDFLAAQKSNSGSTSSTSTTTKYVNVSSGSLNLRASASTSAAVLSSLAKGTAVTVLSEANGWAKVSANGKTGFVSSDFLAAQKSNSGSTSSTSTTTKYVNVSSGSLNLRASASTSAAVLSSLAKGTAVTVLSEANGWAKVSANGKTGFVSSDFLAAQKSNSGSTSSTSTTTKYVNVSSGSLNLRASASTSAAVLSSLAKGTAVTVLSEANGWAKVSANGKTGYVSTQYLSAQKATGTPPTETTGPAATPTVQYVNVSSGSLNMRNGASTNASIIVKLAKSTQVKVLSEADGWAKIEAYGKTGYVSSQYLSDSAPNSASAPAKQTVTKYVKVAANSSLNVRTSASTSSDILTTLKNGAMVTVESESNGWAKIQINGQSGYVSSQYLSSVNSTSPSKDAPTTETRYVNVSAGSSLDMYKTPAVNSSVIVKLARGVEVTISEDKNGWAKVTAYGQTGYVQSQYLTNTKPAPGADPSQNNDTSPGNATIEKYVNVVYGSSLNMRSTPSTSGKIITKLARGTIVTVYSDENGWAKVTANGLTGYVSSQYLMESAPFNPNTSGGTVEKVYEDYNISLDDMVNKQMAVNPQTDKKYNCYIRSDALKLTGSSTGIVEGTGWSVRGGAGTNYWLIGKVNNQDTVQILSTVKGADGYNWYQIAYNKTWVNASPEDVSYYVNPDNFLNNSVDSLQFLKLSVTANLSASEVNERILKGKGILEGTASTFITAGNTYGVNEIYLIAHALLETSNGTSQLATGVQVNGKTVYNMYGIGAYDGSAVTSGAQFAYNAGWFTPEAAIIGGAKFIADGYISAGQDTLYKMRWNPSSAVTNSTVSHEYASDIGWALKQVDQINNLYSLLDSYKLILDIPKYR